MNLTQRPPRSLRILLGGYALLPRLLDKCRAKIAGSSGEYHYNCPLDQHFFKFTGVDHEALKAEVAKGLGDGELLEWIMQMLSTNAPHGRFGNGVTISKIALPTATWKHADSSPRCSTISQRRVRTSPPGPTCLTLMIM